MKKKLLRFLLFLLATALSLSFIGIGLNLFLPGQDLKTPESQKDAIEVMPKDGQNIQEQEKQVDEKIQISLQNTKRYIIEVILGVLGVPLLLLGIFLFRNNCWIFRE